MTIAVASALSGQQPGYGDLTFAHAYTYDDDAGVVSGSSLAVTSAEVDW